MAVLLTRTASVLAKVESTEGQDSSPTAAEGFYATFTELPAPQMNFVRNEQYTGKGSLLPGVATQRFKRIGLEQNLRGSGAAYSSSVRPKADALLRLCGFLATGSFTGGSEKFDYTLLSDSFESFTVYAYVGGEKHPLLGSRGLPSFTFRLAGFSSLRGVVSGAYVAPTDTAVVYPTGEPTITYPVMLGSAFQIGSQNFAAKHGEITLDIGRTLVARDDATSASGYAGFVMPAQRTPRLTFSCEATNEAGFPFWSNLMAGTQMDCTFQIGSTQYNRIKVSCPVLQFENLQYADRNGLLMYTANCLLIDPAGGDADLTITFD